MPDRVPTFKGAVGSFRYVGAATVDDNFLSIFNKTGSGVLVAVRRLTVQGDKVQAVITDALRVKTTRITTAPSTGTLKTPVAWDSTTTHATNVEIRDFSTADDTRGTLTATPGTPLARQVFGERMHTGAGQKLFSERDLLAEYPYPDDPLILREGEGVLVTIIGAGTSGGYYLVNAMIEEFTYYVPPGGGAAAFFLAWIQEDG